MTPWVTRLIFANAAMYLAMRTFPAVLPSLVLVPIMLPTRPWTLVTYMFLHANFIHILFNMLVLYFFGPMLEMRLGGRRFLTLYFVSGIAAALVSVFFTPRAIIVGASGAVYGTMLGFARFWPRQQIYIWGVLPIQARWLVVVMTAMSLYAGVSGSRDGVAHFAHLGGFLGGLLYLLWIEWRSPARKFKRQAQASAPPVRDLDSVAERWRSIRREDIHPLNREEIDRIMQKLDRSGPSSLTFDERATLERFAGERSADN
ncbi:MAG: rhomboid family intramembrane serine protease [Gemmatimonadota bacterium]|nr:rhomboid family intramembrane serine protease [Gemmatimonadota bacterium]MDH3367372.1 rhomboid family intramembrane serine protease [Gemmatimonadota bacterium]MDH3477959.1 rhomboid family intramembrane serine protease [Gemmatimonadota bacterium]MDH3569778.1 rhomboid family intramembrane serine protease [Gemmatimonadota bacterium]MDH5549391.1 rhomboid family intramembrane serine protease [Gemmatimonadota bacterium]